MLSLKVAKLLPASAKVGELLQSFSVRWCFTYLSVAALHSSLATTACVSRMSARSLKYLSISSGRSSSKLGAACSCCAGKLANTILGWAASALTAGIAGGLGGTGTGACGVGGAGAGGGACGRLCVFACGGELVGLAVVLVDACC